MFLLEAYDYHQNNETFYESACGRKKEPGVD